MVQLASAGLPPSQKRVAGAMRSSRSSRRGRTDERRVCGARTMNRTQVVLWSTLFLVGVSIYFLVPTISWYRMPVSERLEREQDKDPMILKILNLGLDLRGGTHLVLELDRSKLNPKINVTDALERAIEIIRNRVDQFGVA